LKKKYNDLKHHSKLSHPSQKSDHSLINASKSLHLDFDKHEILIDSLIEENKILKSQVLILKEDVHKA